MDWFLFCAMLGYGLLAFLNLLAPQTRVKAQVLALGKIGRFTADREATFWVAAMAIAATFWMVTWIIFTAFNSGIDAAFRYRAFVRAGYGLLFGASAFLLTRSMWRETPQADKDVSTPAKSADKSSDRAAAQSPDGGKGKPLEKANKPSDEVATKPASKAGDGEKKPLPAFLRRGLVTIALGALFFGVATDELSTWLGRLSGLKVSATALELTLYDRRQAGDGRQLSSTTVSQGNQGEPAIRGRSLTQITRLSTLMWYDQKRIDFLTNDYIRAEATKSLVLSQSRPATAPPAQHVGLTNHYNMNKPFISNYLVPYANCAGIVDEYAPNQAAQADRFARVVFEVRRLLSYPRLPIAHDRWDDPLPEHAVEQVKPLFREMWSISDTVLMLMPHIAWQVTSPAPQEFMGALSSCLKLTRLFCKLPTETTEIAWFLSSRTTLPACLSADGNERRRKSGSSDNDLEILDDHKQSVYRDVRRLLSSQADIRARPYATITIATLLGASNDWRARVQELDAWITLHQADYEQRKHKLAPAVRAEMLAHLIRARQQHALIVDDLVQARQSHHALRRYLIEHMQRTVRLLQEEPWVRDAFLDLGPAEVSSKGQPLGRFIQQDLCGTDKANQERPLNEERLSLGLQLHNFRISYAFHVITMRLQDPDYKMPQDFWDIASRLGSVGLRCLRQIDYSQQAIDTYRAYTTYIEARAELFVVLDKRRMGADEKSVRDYLTIISEKADFGRKLVVPYEEAHFRDQAKKRFPDAIVPSGTGEILDAFERLQSDVRYLLAN